MRHSGQDREEGLKEAQKKIAKGGRKLEKGWSGLKQAQKQGK